MIVEPMAGDRPGAEPQSRGRLYYAGIDHDLRANLALAGSRRRPWGPGGRGQAARGHRHGRLPRVRRAAETPFNTDFGSCGHSRLHVGVLLD